MGAGFARGTLVFFSEVTPFSGTMKTGSSVVSGSCGGGAVIELFAEEVCGYDVAGDCSESEALLLIIGIGLSLCGGAVGGAIPPVFAFGG